MRTISESPTRGSRKKLDVDRDSALSIKLDLVEGDQIKEIISRKNGLFAVSKNAITRIVLPDELDPQRRSLDAPIEKHLHLPHGSQDPIVSRTILQTRYLSELFFAGDPNKIFDLTDLAWDLMNSLISLRHVKDRLSTEIDQAISEIEKDLDSYRLGKSPRTLPIIPYYDIEFRAFVNEVRRSLNKISELFSLLTDAKIGSGHFHNATKWAVEARGKDSELAKMLDRDQSWIGLWIDMRTAIEHPTSDKYIETLNFGLDGDRKIRLPTWRFVHPSRQMQKPQNLLEVFGYVITNLLKFYEELLIMLLDGHQPEWIAIDFLAVDEDRRDPENPMRWQAVQYARRQ